MESPAIARYIPQKSKKRVFPGSSSAAMEPEVVEISPPSDNRASKSKAKAIEQKQVTCHEIIDVDMDEDRNDVVFIEGKVESNKKRKDVTIMSSKPSNSVDLGHSSKSSASGSDNFFDLDGVGSDSYTTDVYADDYVFEDDYLTLQSHFDNMDLPSGVEAPIPWMPDTLKMKKRASANQLVTPHTQLEVSHPHGANPFWASEWRARSKKSSAVRGGSSYSKNVPSVETPHKIHHRKMPSNYTYDQVGGMKVPGASSYFPSSSNIQVGSSASLSFSQMPMDTVYPLGVDTPSSKLHKQIMKNHLELNDAYSEAVIFQDDVDDYTMEAMLMDQDAGNSPTSSSLVGSSSSMARLDNEDVLKRYENFKKFDTVLDHSDHYYSTRSESMKQPPKNWAKKIQEEWRILEKDLPDTIFVRAYESRMDLLRAVIIGAEGTPYHDGLFFFDVCFRSSYPNVPPLVYYHSGGLRINPNLYTNGKVCLSLLNTWAGGEKERWVPGVSTMLQVLVSIQGLILNMKPYFNEPGFAHSSGSPHGEQCSLQYNENTLILSLKTMVYTMNKPPKNFEDLVIGHFRNRVRDILMACKAYTEGVQVGCLVRGGVQDVDEGNRRCSPEFKNNVASYIKILVGSFKKMGANEAEEFLGLSEKISPLPPNPAHSHAYPTFPFTTSITAAAYNHYW